MMGYSTQSKGYKVWDVESSKLVVSRDVVFNESSVDSLGIDIQPNEVSDSNVAGPGGEMKKEVDGNIDSSPDSEGDNDGEFEESPSQLLFPRLLQKPSSSSTFFSRQ